MKFSVLFLLILIFAQSLYSQAWKTYPYAPDGSKISFPVDEGRHSEEPIEWWYSIGHFTGEDSGTPYSYMLTYFHIQQFGYDGFRILNLCNESTGEFYSEVMPLTYASISTTELDINASVGYFAPFLKTETWSNTTDDSNLPLPYNYKQMAGTFTLPSNFSIDFNHDAIKRPLIVADSGFLNIGDASYSFYYSQTRLTLAGNLTINNQTEAISGTSWIDRQYGNFSPTNENDYEWFSLQLSNGMDINAYNVFGADKSIPTDKAFRILAVQVNDDEQYTTSDFSIERLSYAYTEDKERCYSQSWRLISQKNDIDVVFSANHISNEVKLPETTLDLPSRFYEGSVAVSGSIKGESVTGMGFAELIHHYEEPVVIFDKPTLQGANNLLLSWKAENKDEGNPLYYTLSYSINHQKALFPIVKDITDTFFVWNFPEMKNNDYIQIFLNSHSLDGTLSSDVDADYTHIISSTASSIENYPLKVYPNPATKEIHIRGEGIVLVELFDANGKQIILNKTKNAKLNSFNVEHLKPGAYIIKTTQSNYQTSTNILMVE